MYLCRLKYLAYMYVQKAYFLKLLFFVTDVEELSARLSLMAASSSEKGELLEPRIGPISDGNYLNNRCVYLEQLLHGKIPR